MSADSGIAQVGFSVPELSRAGSVGEVGMCLIVHRNFTLCSSVVRYFYDSSSLLVILVGQGGGCTKFECGSLLEYYIIFICTVVLVGIGSIFNDRSRRSHTRLCIPWLGQPAVSHVLDSGVEEV